MKMRFYVKNNKGKKMKGLWCLLMGLLPFGLNANEMKVPFTVPVDLSKKGAVYETDFQAPWNIWGSLVMFDLVIRYERDIELTDEQRSILYAIRYGKKNNDIPIPKEENKYFKFKVTLTPLGFTSDDVTIWSGASRFPEMIKKEFKDVEKIEFVVSVPLYGGESNYTKTIMIADLQRLSNYHIKVESLEDVEIPEDLILEFEINRYSSKH